MATNIYSSTPKAVLEGIKDVSGRIVPLEPEAQPQHLPLIYTFAEKGDDSDAFVVTGGSLINTYGEKLLDINSKFATHVTPFIIGLNSEVNLMMVKRLRPEGASTAWLRFSLGITKRTITETKNIKEEYLDSKGNKQTRIVRKEVDAGLGEGYYLKWYVNPRAEPAKLATLSDEDQKLYQESMQFGKGYTVQDVGFLTDPTVNPIAQGITTVGVDVERVYPIMDLQVSHFGDYGNHLGVRLSAPNLKSVVRPDRRFFESTLTRLFRVEFVKRANARAATTTVNNNYGEGATDFTWKPGQVNPYQNNEDIYIGSAILDFYRNLDISNGRLPVYGPFNKMKVYEQNIEHILKVLYEAEKAQDDKVLKALRDAGEAVETVAAYKRPRLTTSNEEEIQKEAYWQMDFVSGKSFEGYDYRMIKVLDMRSNGKVLDETTEHWAVDGNDGKMGNAEYNRLVSLELQSMMDSTNPILDLARYPFSVFYDTGFPFENKQDLVNVIRARKDTTVCLATHYVPTDPREITTEDGPGVKPIGRSTEAALVRSLASWATAFPESEVHNTKACRANIIMQCGNIVNTAWKGRVPMTYEIAMKRARFMGASDGKMRPGYGYDQDGIKQLRYTKQVNNPFVPDEAREINWTHGATWAQYYDRNTMFFPAVRTVYRDETSVLISDINMLIAVDLEKVCFRTWRRLVGDSKLTNEQFIALSDQYILEDVEGRYDSRVTIIPETYYTQADDARGFSWHCNVHMYAPNMKTVGIMTVVTHRLNELQGA